MPGHEYLEHLRRRRRDLEENAGRYLGLLKGLAERYGGRLYVFGSRLRGDALASSDLDVLLEVPDGVDRLEVLHEARRLVPNSMVEIHVLNESDAQLFKRLIRDYREV